MAIFKGAGVAIITPFHEDGRVDYEKFGELIEYQIDGGHDGCCQRDVYGDFVL